LRVCGDAVEFLVGHRDPSLKRGPGLEDLGHGPGHCDGRHDDGSAAAHEAVDAEHGGDKRDPGLRFRPCAPQEQDPEEDVESPSNPIHADSTHLAEQEESQKAEGDQEEPHSDSADHPLRLPA
jgi:hypothetical protein